MPSSYSLSSAYRVVDLLAHQATKAALQDAHCWVVSMGFTVCIEPAFEEPELDDGELPPAQSEAVSWAFDMEGGRIEDALNKHAIGKLPQPSVVSLAELTDEFTATMRVNTEDFDVAYDLFVGNIKKRILRLRSSPSFAIGEIPQFQVFRRRAGERSPDDKTDIQPPETSEHPPTEVPSAAAETLPFTIWSRNDIEVQLTGLGIADLDPAHPTPSGAWEQKHFVYARVAGVMSEGACQRLREQLSRLVPSVICSVSVLQPRQFTNEPSTPLPWITGDLLLNELSFFKHCLDAFYFTPGSSHSIDGGLHNAVKLLVLADEQDDRNISLALAFSAIEAMLCEGDANVTDQLAWKAPTLLARDGELRLRAEPAVKKLYNKRSRVLHGDELTVDEASHLAVRRLAAGIIRAIVERREFRKKTGYDKEKPDRLFEDLKRANRLNTWVDGVPDGAAEWLPKEAPKSPEDGA